MTPEVTAFIEACLEHDAHESSRRQHHTSKYIYDRLVSERGFAGCYSSVCRYARQLRRRSGGDHLAVVHDQEGELQSG